MYKLRVSAFVALGVVETYRVIAYPNEGFRKQLKEYEKEIGVVSPTGSGKEEGK